MIFDSKKRKFFLCGASVFAIILISVFHWFFILKNSKNATPPSTMFVSEREYLDYLKNEVSFDGVKLNVVEVAKGDNFWKIARDYKVNIDTLISANPFWENLNARTKQNVVVPTKKGVLYFINNTSRIDNLCSMYNVKSDEILIQKMSFRRRLQSLFSDNDKPIAVFIQNIKPDESMMTKSLAKQYSLREMFRSPLGGRYSSYFGRRVDPIVHTDGFHDGVDIASPYGTPVGAACDGVVSDAGWMGGFGNAVIVEHKNGYRTLYGHLSSINVSSGQKIKAGQFIGKVGSTGWSTGPHLHFSLSQNGRFMNPMQVLW